MTALPDNLPPRLLDREQAAAYCGVSVNHFGRHCPVQPLRMGSRVLWDRLKLDGWIAELQGEGQSSAGDPLMEALHADDAR